MKLEFVTNNAYDRLFLRDGDDRLVGVWNIGQRYNGEVATFDVFIEAANNPSTLNYWPLRDENEFTVGIYERFNTVVASIPREDGTPGVDVWELAAWLERCRFYGIDPSAIGEPTTAEIMAEIDEILDLSDL